MLWLLVSILGAFSTSLTTIFTKIGIKNVKSNFATMYRTGIVIICCIIMCLITRSFSSIKTLTLTNWIYLSLSGLATGCAWLFEYYALNMKGVNPVTVNSINKLSILLTMLFSYLVLKEKFTKKSLLGLLILTIGIILIIIFSL